MFKTGVLTKSRKKNPGKTSAVLFVLKGKSHLKGIFSKITERKNTERIIEDAREYNESIVNTVREPLLILDGNLRVNSANKSFYDVFKVTPKVTIGRLIYDLGNKQWNIPKLRNLLETILPNNATFNNYEIEHVFPHSGRRIMILNARCIPRPPAKPRIILLAIEDITDKKLIQETLKESEEKFKQFFENSNDAIFITDSLTRRLVSCNKKAEKLVGRSKVEILSMKVENLYPKDRVKETIKGFNNQIKGKIKLIESEVLTKTGKRIPVEISTSIVEITREKYLLGIFREITERKKVEMALQKQTHDLAERIKELNCLYNFSKLIQEHGNSVEKLFQETIHLISSAMQYPELACIRITFLGRKFQTKNFIETALRYVSDIIVNCEHMGTVEVHYQREKLKTGGHFFLKEEKELIDVIAERLGRNTEHSQSEEKIRENEEKFRAVFEGAGDGILACDPKTRKFIFANPKICKLIGYSENELVNLNVEDIHPKKDLPYVLDQFQKQAQRKISVAKDIPVLKKDRTIILCDVNSQPIKIGKQILLIGFFKDITKSKKAVMELKESEEKFRAIFDNANDGILLADQKTKKFSTGNNTVCQMLGYSLEEIKKLGVTDVHPKEDVPYVIEQFERQVRGEITVAKDLPMKRKDGSVFYADVNSSLIKLAGKTYLLGLFRDVTERRQADEYLMLLNQKNNLILSSLTEGILGLDLQGNHTLINSAAARMLGYETEELIGRPSHNIWHHTKPDGSPYPKEDCLINASYRDGTAHNSSTEVFWRKNGTFFPVEYVSTPIIEQGLLTGAVVTFHDITERKKSEEQLKFKTVILEAESEASIDGILIVDENGKTLLTNKQFREMWVIPQEILESKDDEKMLQYAALKLANPNEFIAKMKYLYDHKDEKSMEEIQFKDGKVFDRYSTPLLDTKRKYLGRIWYFHDKTAIKQAEIKLREEKAKLEKYFDVIGIIALVLSVKGDILLLNKRGCEILGYQPNEVVGKNWITDFRLKDKNSEPDNFLGELIKDKVDNTYFEHSVITKDGKEKNITWGSIPIIDEAGNVQAFMCAGEDITTLRQAEVTITQLQEFDRLKDEFLNIAAHELRTPLTSIIGLSEIIKTQKASLPSQMAEYPDIIYNEGLRLGRVIKRILTITRYESGKEEVHLESVNLTTLIPSLLPGLNILAKDKKLTIATNLKEESLQVESDKEMISEVIINLVDNSIKYGSENNTITISAYRDISGIDNGRIRIDVADQGPGIPPDLIDKLFNKFSQLEPSLSRSQEGTGLGLYICKLIVEKLGGRIGVESEVGKGSTFYFTLPIENVVTQKRDLDLKAV
jgi:PAS domain S-box-containing protein